ncbi:Hypothetical_protein [Hexamita inflata]|uniref:Hypothetical_protein n=1 Tax=Hexamita inflata TaxID=28002 RepID=A0AA86NBG5_9EUKA|nr:Hypothetical protein HINF_LOCUS3890 [Hexamita inflata]CAI9972875.1 Hypothetical protein HINF_LOCUS60520 [Hexamita inflata]
MSRPSTQTSHRRLTTAEAPHLLQLQYETYKSNESPKNSQVITIIPFIQSDSQQKSPTIFAKTQKVTKIKKLQVTNSQQVRDLVDESVQTNITNLTPPQIQKIRIVKQKAVIKPLQQQFKPKLMIKNYSPLLENSLKDYQAKINNILHENDKIEYAKLVLKGIKEMDL